MKLLVINALSALLGGGQTYLINFLKHLPNDDNFRIILIVNRKNNHIFQEYSSSRVQIHKANWASKSHFHRTLWEYLGLPNFLKKEHATHYYAPGGVMITRMPKGVVSITALRNMLPFDRLERSRYPFMSKTRLRCWLLHYVFLKSYRRADKVIFISKYSNNIIQQYIPSINSKSKIIPHGIDSRFLNTDQSVELPKHLIKNRFYLYVSILDVYKAQKEVIQAWKILMDQGFEFPLVLVGPNYSKYGKEVVDLIESLKLNKKIFYLGKMDYEKLPSFYRSARALLFASSCECCPNILLEKLASGRPIICSNIEPMPEFGGEAVLYFDPYNPNTLVNQVLRMEKEPGLMKEIEDKSRKQALKYDWGKTVKKTVDFLFE